MGGTGARLLERERELRAIGAALAAARARSGRLLLIEGAPGMGKSSLLEAAGARAAALGLTVLRARGAEHERALAFGGALQLFERTLARAGEARRAQLLSGAAGLAGELFDLAGERPALPEEGRALAIIHGLYWVTANLSEPDPSSGRHTSRPLALLIDDAHLLDAPSIRFLLYLGARLEELPVSVLVALRPDDPGAPAGLRDLGSEPAAILRPQPLSSAAVEDLLAAALSTGAVAAELTHAALTVTGGNPFLLRELIAELRADGVEDVARLATVAPSAVLLAVVGRLGRLEPAATAIAKALVVLGDGTSLAEASALAGVAPGAAGDALDGLAREGILAPGVPLRFAHPLIGQVVAADLAPGWRQANELRAARILAAAGAPQERVATHLLSASAGGEAWVVDVLERAAAGARARGAPELAAGYLERAVREPPVDAERARLLSALAEAEFAAGLPGARAHLEQALGLIAQPQARAQLLGSLGRLLAVGGRYPEAIAVLERGLSELADPGCGLARELRLLIACTGASGDGSAMAMAAALDELRTGPAGEATALECGVLALAASQAALLGHPATEFAPLALRALEGGQLVAEVSRDAGLLLTPAAVALLYADLLEVSLTVLGAALERARVDGSVLATATVSYLRAWPLYFTGQVADAIADLEQALAARRHGWSVHAGAACALLAHARIEAGELDGAAAALADADSLGLGTEHWARAALLVARGRLRLAAGDPAGALADLRECEQLLERQGVSGRSIPWREHAALAALALGDRPQALTLAAEEQERAQRIGAARLVGGAQRIRGLVEGGEQGIQTLTAAVETLERSPAKLELARALVDLGATVRRSGRPAASREPLHHGLELAERCGARRLAERARDELHAAGARPRRAARSGLESLTPSERRVAALAATGLTNREIAQRLFVTTKAVEYHLHHTFQKLGISSRTQLPGVDQLDAGGAVLDVAGPQPALGR